MPQNKYDKKKKTINFHCNVCGGILKGGKDGLCTNPHTFRDVGSLLDYSKKVIEEYPEWHPERIKYEKLFDTWKDPNYSNSLIIK